MQPHSDPARSASQQKRAMTMASIARVLEGIHTGQEDPLDGYQGHTDLRTIDIWSEQTSTTSDVIYETGTLGDDRASLSHWINSCASAVPVDKLCSSGLKLLIVHEEIRIPLDPSPAAQRFLQMAFGEFQLPSVCLRTYPIVSEFMSFPWTSAPDGSRQQSYRLTTGWCALSWSYCPAKKTSRGILSIDSGYLRPVADIFRDVTRELKEFFDQPWFLGFVAAIVALTVLAGPVSGIQNRTYDMANRMIASPTVESGVEDPAEESRLALYDAAGAYQYLENMAALQSLHELLSKQLAESRAELTNDNETLRQQAETLDECLRHLEQKATFLKLWMETATGRYTMQLAALFNIVAQRDSKVSIEIAAASRALAIESKKDQHISIAIAKASREIAVESKRDSSSMKTIAAVTMFFLPGTFVASLFATPMFQWTSPTGLRVQSQIWIYWATTIPLTLLTIAIWWVWLRFMTGREQAELRDVEDFNGMTDLPADVDASSNNDISARTPEAAKSATDKDVKEADGAGVVEAIGAQMKNE